MQKDRQTLHNWDAHVPDKRQAGMYIPHPISRFHRGTRGQSFVIITVASIVLVGAVALGTDIAVFYYNWVVLQKAVDSAVLAGANYLPDNTTQAQQTATTYATNNGVTSSEIQ